MPTMAYYLVALARRSGYQFAENGLIQAATGGKAVSLIGGAVKNEGTILAHAGQVNLVAGKAMTMDFDGDGLIQLAVAGGLR